MGGEGVSYRLQTAPEPAGLGPTSDGRGAAVPPQRWARGGGAGRRGPGKQGRLPGKQLGGLPGSGHLPPVLWLSLKY